MWSCIVDRGIWSSAALLRMDVIGDRSIDWATAVHVSSHIFLRPLRGLSLTLPEAKARFSQSSRVALQGGALPKRSVNTRIITVTVCRLLSFVHPHSPLIAPQ
jgi:hypothetical protein